MRSGNISNICNVILYIQWTAFCTDLQIDNLIEEPNLPYVKILQVYGHRVFHGHYYSKSK